MQQSGRVTVKADGESFRSKNGTSSMTPGGLTREENEMTDQGDFVFKEKYEPGEIKTTLIHVADTDLVKIQKGAEITVTYEPDVGKKYTLANAVCTKVGELRGGEVEVTYRGDPIKAA